MCYSKETSINVFLLNIITSYALFTYNSSSNVHKILALFFGFVGFMQLFDWILWSNQDITDPHQASLNYKTTKIAMFFNHLQPIVFGYLIYLYQGSLGDISKYILGLYVFAITLYTIDTYNKIDYTGVSNDKRPSLEWDWNANRYSLVVYLIFLAALCILSYQNFEYPLNILLAFLSVFTFLLSKAYYKSKTIGRFWCKMTAFTPLLIMIMGVLKLINI